RYPLAAWRLGKLHQAHGALEPLPIGLVQQFIYMRRLEWIFLPELVELDHHLAKLFGLRCLAFITSVGVVQLGYPDRLAILREDAQRPFRIFAIDMPDRDIPLDAVFLHALEGAHMSPSG